MRKLTLTTTLLCITQSHAATYGSVQVDEITSIYDADTFRANIAEWPAIIGENIRIRANGFDAPEIRGKCEAEKQLAQKAKAITEKALEAAETIELRNMERGKYFRIIADIYIDGEPLLDVHLSAGTARPYDGGKRESWCN